MDEGGQSQWMKVGFSLVKIPTGGTKSPEKKKAQTPLSWPQIKLWGRMSKAGKGRLFLFLVSWKCII